MVLFASSMHLLAVLAAALFSPAVLADGLQIEKTLEHECKQSTKKGDTVNMHYRGRLQATGVEFDASYNRGIPLTFTIGVGQVIKGWDLGLLDMCPGDKRTLTIPSKLAYGDRGQGPIPGGSTLIFETELRGIKDAPKEEWVVKKPKTGKAGEEKERTEQPKAEEEPKEDKTEAEEPKPEENPQEEKNKEEL